MISLLCISPIGEVSDRDEPWHARGVGLARFHEWKTNSPDPVMPDVRRRKAAIHSIDADSNQAPSPVSFVRRPANRRLLLCRVARTDCWTQTPETLLPLLQHSRLVPSQTVYAAVAC
ncbi:hypothetical protein RSSM_06663 [Rhodopirellula sallentina SM41]|uniref:Uncharacterized protein n=1 Tax=Rhodopirellula sallentina SM41 TaxID=1263870 RepID=M5TS73_9BACT|nr:hypothetical protein RSSM_06663 [Rhodopirellula sallentina SM41]